MHIHPKEAWSRLRPRPHERASTAWAMPSSPASVAMATAKAGAGAALAAASSNGLNIGWAGTSRVHIWELVDALRPPAADHKRFGIRVKFYRNSPISVGPEREVKQSKKFGPI